PRTSWRSATCPTTCRCWRGPAGGSPWPTRTPRCSRRPTRSSAATTTTASPPTSSAGSDRRPDRLRPTQRARSPQRSHDATQGSEVLAGTAGRVLLQHARGQRRLALAATHLLELHARRHLLCEQRRLDPVEQALEPSDQLRLR